MRPRAAPRVTIAVPTYNRAHLLHRALKSLSRQTYGEVEIVICDNASTDATPEVVAALAAEDARIRPHRSASNVGAFKNFELGLLLARGEYFMWAADDDLWDPELVGTLVERLDARPDLVLACAEARYMSGDGTAFDYFPEGVALRSRPVAGPVADRLRALINGHFGNLFYGLYRREALIRTFRGRPVGTAFSVYGATTVGAYGPQSGVNEVPILIQVAARGGIEVADLPLWSKATTPSAYRDARAEAQRRDGSSSAMSTPLDPASIAKALAASRWRWRADASYHRAVFADIASSVRALDVPAALKRELFAKFQLRVLKHYLSFEWRQALTPVVPHDE